eukprot:2854744-Rhodomonas_salina.2
MYTPYTTPVLHESLTIRYLSTAASSTLPLPLPPPGSRRGSVLAQAERREQPTWAWVRGCRT